ncbi:MAG: 50S ribosomal protein L29 [Candidatus Pacebacteria bacterium]|jgi:ribosomal protein L29|nr:50S ribosomal protein L29 [Candidatus Paceibacterota bacterium]
MKYTDIAKKNMSELEELVLATRAELQAERFKDRFAKKASIIRQAKLTIARALTEMKARTRQGDTK